MMAKHTVFAPLAYIVLLGCLSLLQLQACGSAASNSDSTSSGQVESGVLQNTRSGMITMQFKNESSAQGSLSSIRSHASSGSSGEPTFYGMKIIAAYLSEDVDPVTQDNTGQNLMFYLNEECQNDIMHCNTGPGTAEDGNPMDKILGANSYFDLTDPSAANEALNGQTQSVLTGTFRYVRMEFCKYEPNADNVEWEYPGVPRRSFHRSGCGTTSEEMDPPLVIDSSSAALTFVASYDLSGSVTLGPDAYGDDCATDADGQRVCFSVPAFTPSVLVE